MSERIVKEILLASSDLKARIAGDTKLVSKLHDASQKIKAALACGGTLYSSGNGGSACDSMHLTEELVARYKRERPGMRALHFMDPGTVTCWSNDYEYEGAFERQVKTFCTPKDVYLGISTSGRSKNILRAFAAARALGTYTIGFTGKDGGAFPEACDLSIVVPAKETERIQEAHITFIHIICELLET